MKIPQLIVTDIDGVIAIDGKLDPTVKGALKWLRTHGVLYTVATGRGYYRFRDCVPKALAPTFPLILENGGRICEPDGTPLRVQPIAQHTIPLLRKNMGRKFVRGVDFFQMDDNRYVVLEHPGLQTSPGKAFLPERLVAARYNTVDAFFAHLRTARCCKLTYFTHDGKHLRFPKQVNSSRNENYDTVMRRRVSKGTALRFLCREHGLSLTNVLIAGNDYNDLELFKLPARWRIAVGDDCPELVKLATDWVPNPQALGQYLAQFIRPVRV